MILSFADTATESVWLGGRHTKMPTSIKSVARRKLRMIHSAENINDLRVPPGNRLEKLSGNLSAYHSIRINQQWRITFRWEDLGAHEVKIVDYH